MRRAAALQIQVIAHSGGFQTTATWCLLLGTIFIAVTFMYRQIRSCRVREHSALLGGATPINELLHILREVPCPRLPSEQYIDARGSWNARSTPMCLLRSARTRDRPSDYLFKICDTLNRFRQRQTKLGAPRRPVLPPVPQRRVLF